MYQTIDVSYAQGMVNWEEVKKEIDFAILRCGYGGNRETNDDREWKRNADECTRLGIPFGTYLYSYAENPKEAIGEADHVLRLINGYRLSLPIFLDLEDANTTGKCTNREIADIADAFCSKLENAGYFVGVYASKSWFETRLNDPRFDRWTKWVAQWAQKNTYKGTVALWQYTSSGTVAGIAGRVDRSECYRNFPQIIKEQGLNGFAVESEETLPEEKAPTEETEAPRNETPDSDTESKNEAMEKTESQIRSLLKEVFKILKRFSEKKDKGSR